MRGMVAFWLGFITIFHLGCSQRPPPKPPAPLAHPVVILQPVSCYGDTPSTLCKRNLFSQPLTAAQAQEFYQSFYFEAETTGYFSVVSQKATEDIFYQKNTLPGPLTAKDFVQWQPSFVKEAQSQKFRYLFIPLVYHYREREGSSLGVTKPASLALELVAVDADTGLEIFRQTFDETQVPFSEDIFEFGNLIRRKGQWISARQMTREAAKKILVQCHATLLLTEVQ